MKKVALIGKFFNLHDEEYIARSFEELGCSVLRIEQATPMRTVLDSLSNFAPDVCIHTKYDPPEGGGLFQEEMRRRGILTVCWLFDLYWGYGRQHRIFSSPFFRARYVVTTDGGHQQNWRNAQIKHFCVRQGIYKPECYLEPVTNPQGVVFIGSDNPLFGERTAIMGKLATRYGDDFHWHGKKNTNDVRGRELNRIYAASKIVVGDSVYSPHYWSNRVVETLGRGGFLIHQEVEGLKEEYPDLVTYQKGDVADLFEKIDYYLTHEAERLALVQKNFEHVRDNYTMEKKCAELLTLVC